MRMETVTVQTTVPDVASVIEVGSEAGDTLISVVGVPWGYINPAAPVLTEEELSTSYIEGEC